jgi:hypothetical protein
MAVAGEFQQARNVAGNAVAATFAVFEHSLVVPRLVAYARDYQLLNAWQFGGYTNAGRIYHGNAPSSCGALGSFQRIGTRWKVDRC